MVSSNFVEESDDSEVESDTEDNLLPLKKPAWVDEDDETEEMYAVLSKLISIKRCHKQIVFNSLHFSLIYLNTFGYENVLTIFF